MSEPAPLLTTKLFVPRPPSQRVKRDRLIKRLEVARPLTLISAPPGFGKTTLVSEWLSAGRLRAAWLSLDEADNDPGRFWTYVIAALQTLNDRIGAGALPLLQSPQPPSIDAILTLLLNDLATTPDDLALVLDDYHVIIAPVIHEALSFLLDHLPPQLRLILISRVDPLLPLPRLRARGQLTELRADELRFTPAEAAAFLNDVMDLSLAAADIAALEQRTEGWIAGLQLAALSLQDRADPAEFIQSFTGSHRFILDYLIEEVLNRQTPDILNFLLSTSILDRLSAALCDAVIGQNNSQAILEQLDRANLFIVLLDPDRQWFRYHHLFADVLQARLRQSRPDDLIVLHRRASQWFERHASPREAIDHALDSGDLDRAAGLIEIATRPLIHRGEVATLSGWLDRLPTDLYRARPRLPLARAWCALALLEFTAIEPQLQAAEAALRDDDPVLRGEIAALRAIIASTSGDLAQTLDFSKQALAHLPPDDAFLRGLVAVSLGNLYYTTGDPQEAEHYGAEAITQFERAGNLSFELVARSIQAVALEEQGQLHRAAELYRLALQRGQHNTRLLPLSGVAVACLGLGGLLHDWYQLDEAALWFQQGADLCRQLAGLSGVRITLLNGLAAVQRSRRDFAGAIELFKNSETLTRQVPLPEGIEYVETQIALTQLRLGHVTAASAWAERQSEKAPPAADAILSFGDEDRLIVLAQVRAGQGRWAQAEDLLERVLRSGVAAHRSAIQIEAHVLRALARQAQGRTDSALSELEQALTLAEPENYLRPFCDEGAAVRELLTRLRPRLHEARGRAYADRVLAAFAAIDLPVDAPASDVEPLSESLNDREQEVLRLIADGLSNREIADRLVVAVGTVKWYINNLYGKLGVTSRTQALARAKELRLL